MYQLHEAYILKDSLLMHFFLYVLTQIKIFVFGHLPAVSMVNSFIQSPIVNLLMHMLSVINTTSMDFLSSQHNGHVFLLALKW